MLRSNSTNYRPVLGRMFALQAMMLIVLLLGWGLEAASCATVRAEAQELTVSANFTAQQIAPNQTIELNLSRPLQVSEGRLAIFIGYTDLSGLFIATGNVLSYTPGIIPLPTGETPVTIYMISSANEWRELAQLTLNVAASQTAQPVSDQPLAQSTDQSLQQIPDPAQAAAARKFLFTPSLTLGVKSQMAESHFPITNSPQRPTFTDFTLQSTWKTEMTRGWLNSQTQFDVVGSSFQQEALRFAEKGAAAPLVDLSNYLMQFQLNKAKLQVGHTSFGANRHLINSFGSRGLTLSLPVGKRAEVSFAAMNGTSIVGWSNFFGVDRRKHQIVSGTFGFEFSEKRPGALRMEATALHGSLLPLAGFNQGVINDAEQSKGLGFRLLATDKSQRFKLETGFARSRFANPADPLLNQGLPVVPVNETARNAQYLDASYALLQNYRISPTKTANLAINFRHERVDPLFRSVTAFTQADRLQNMIELTGGIGEINATVSHQRFNDNLAEIPSILKTLTRRDVVIVGVPLTAIFTDPANPSPNSVWLPRLSYNLDRTHQFGRGLPVNSGFDSLSQIPDQVSINQLFSAEWQFQKWRLGYRFNDSYQNNRQPGRELADLRNLINAVTIGLNPHSAFDLSLDLNLESARNKELNRVDRTWRVGINSNWRMTPKTTLTAIVSNTLAGDIARTMRNRNTEFDLQWSYQFNFGETGWRKVQGHFFIRFADRYARTRDYLFGLDNLTRLQTINAGVNFVFF